MSGAGFAPHSLSPRREFALRVQILELNLPPAHCDHSTAELPAWTRKTPLTRAVLAQKIAPGWCQPLPHLMERRKKNASGKPCPCQEVERCVCRRSFPLFFI